MTETFPADVLEALPGPILLVGPNGRIRAMNEAATEIFGAGGVGRHYITCLLYTSPSPRDS